MLAKFSVPTAEDVPFADTILTALGCQRVGEVKFPEQERIKGAGPAFWPKGKPVITVVVPDTLLAAIERAMVRKTDQEQPNLLDMALRTLLGSNKDGLRYLGPVAEESPIDLPALDDGSVDEEGSLIEEEEDEPPTLHMSADKVSDLTRRPPVVSGNADPDAAY